jgi:hypothetical protein
MSEEVLKLLLDHIERSYWVVGSLHDLAEGFVIEYDPSVPEEHVASFADGTRYMIDTVAIMLKAGRWPS